MRPSVALCGVLAVGIALLGRAQASIFEQARAKLSDITAPAMLELRAPLTVLENWIEGVGTMFALYRENLELKREIAELRRWQDVALSLENRVRRYEELLNAVPEATVSSITARVIGESNRPFVKTMILNAGTEHGVKKGHAVADERGLIGRIYLTGERTSWVILLTDLSSRVPVIIESSQRRAILSGDNSSTPVLDLDLAGGEATPETAADGDRVLSTGDGGLLPAGIPVGVVMREGRQLRVSLFAASMGEYVRVLEHEVPPPPAAEAFSPTSVRLKPDTSGRPSPSVAVSTTLAPRPAVTRAPRPAPTPAVMPAPMLPRTPAPTPAAMPAPVVPATPELTPAPVFQATQEATPAPLPEATPAPLPEATPAPMPETTPAPMPETTPAPILEAPPEPTPALSGEVP